jgi:hypothetical protein
MGSSLLANKFLFLAKKTSKIFSVKKKKKRDPDVDRCPLCPKSPLGSQRAGLPCPLFFLC